MRGHFCCSHEGEIVTLVLDKVNTLHAAGIAGLEQNVPDTLEIIVKAVLDGPCTPCRGDQRIRARRTGDLGAFRRRLKAVADRLELRRAQPSHNTFPPLSSFGPICLGLYPIAKHAHTPPASVLGGAGSTARPNEQQPTTNQGDDPRPPAGPPRWWLCQAPVPTMAVAASATLPPLSGDVPPQPNFKEDRPLDPRSRDVQDFQDGVGFCRTNLSVAPHPPKLLVHKSHRPTTNI